MITFLKWVSRHATILLFLSAFAALLVPEAASLFFPLIGPAVWLILFLAVIRIDWNQLARHGRKPLKVASALVWLAVGASMVMWGVVSVVDSFIPVPGALKTALVLNAAAPPLMSSPALAMLIGLDAALVLIVIVLATLAMPLVAPAMVQEILGLDAGIETLALMGRLGGLIVTATLAGAIMRRVIGGARIAQAAPTINGVAVLIMIYFAIAMMTGVTDRILADPLFVGMVGLVAFSANVGLQFVGAMLFMRLGRHEALSIGLPSGNRAMALWVAVIPAMHPDVFLYFAMAQFPIYLLPAIMAWAYGRLLVR